MHTEVRDRFSFALRLLVSTKCCRKVVTGLVNLEAERQKYESKIKLNPSTRMGLALRSAKQAFSISWLNVLGNFDFVPRSYPRLCTKKVRIMYMSLPRGNKAIKEREVINLSRAMYTYRDIKVLGNILGCDSLLQNFCCRLHG